MTFWRNRVVAVVAAVVAAVGQMRVRLRSSLWCNNSNSSGRGLDFRFKVLSFKTKTKTSDYAILMFFLNGQSDLNNRYDDDVICGLFIHISLSVKTYHLTIVLFFLYASALFANQNWNVRNTCSIEPKPVSQPMERGQTLGFVET